MAGSSHTLTAQDNLGPVLQITTDFVADDSDASIPTLAVAFPKDVFLQELEFYPGGTNPTASSDLTAVDANSVDRLAGSGTNIVTTSGSTVPIVFSSTDSHPILRAGESVTLTISNNAANDAAGTIVIRATAIQRR